MQRRRIMRMMGRRAGAEIQCLPIKNRFEHIICVYSEAERKTGENPIARVRATGLYDEIVMSC